MTLIVRNLPTLEETHTSLPFSLTPQPTSLGCLSMQIRMSTLSSSKITGPDHNRATNCRSPFSSRASCHRHFASKPISQSRPRLCHGQRVACHPGHGQKVELTRLPPESRPSSHTHRILTRILKIATLLQRHLCTRLMSLQTPHIPTKALSTHIKPTTRCR